MPLCGSSSPGIVDEAAELPDSPFSVPGSTCVSSLTLYPGRPSRNEHPIALSSGYGLPVHASAPIPGTRSLPLERNRGRPTWRVLLASPQFDYSRMRCK
jgi:hypothetical protein